MFNSRSNRVGAKVSQAFRFVYSLYQYTKLDTESYIVIPGTCILQERFFISIFVWQLLIFCLDIIFNREPCDMNIINTIKPQNHHCFANICAPSWICRNITEQPGTILPLRQQSSMSGAIFGCHNKKDFGRKSIVSRLISPL